MKELITGQSIADARKAGLQEIVVSEGAIITPQAKDDAKLFGIVLRVGSQVQAQMPVQNAVIAQNQLTTHRNAMNTNNINNGANPVQAGWSTPAPQFGNAAPSASSAVSSVDMAGQVAEQVVARLQSLLGTNTAANPAANMAQTVAQVVSEVMHTPSAACAAPSGGSATLNGVDVVPFPVNAPSISVQGEMNIEEALLPGENGPGVTRFCFANASLDWTFSHDEVLVVTKGTVQISQNGSAVTLVNGGAARMRKGTSVILTAQGEVCFVTSSFTK